MDLFDDVGAKLSASRAKLKFTDADARHVGLRGMQEVIAGYAFGFSSMVRDGSADGLRSTDQIYASYGKSNLAPDEMRKLVENAWKNGLLTLFHFKLDCLFQNLMKAMGTYEARCGYGKMTGQILKACNLNDQRTRDVLALVGYLRNSLHNNGMHRGPDLSIEIADMKYDLRKDKAVACAGWQHIFSAFEETITILDEILAAPVIQKLSVPIPDDYASNPVD